MRRARSCVKRSRPIFRTRMSAAYAGFRDAIPTNNLDAAVAEHSARWRASSPTSPYVAFAEARFEYASAWQARGQCYAHCVGQDTWQQFALHLARAEEILEGEPARLKQTALWHELLLAVTLDSQQARSPPERVFAAAVKRWPYYYDFYHLMLTRMTPRWGGSWDEVESFIEHWTNELASRDGRSLYARLYLLLAGDGYPLETTNADWKKMRAGFEDLIAKYPDSRTPNLFATYACFASDKAAFIEATHLIGPEPWDETDWLPAANAATCKARFQLSSNKFPAN